MAITKSIKSKLEKCGVNHLVDKRTRAYGNLLRKNQWSDEQYTRYLKNTLKNFATKEKKIVAQVASNKFREQVREKNKVRYTGSTVVKFIISEGRSGDTQELGSVRLETLTSRQQTETKNMVFEFHTLSSVRTFSDIKEVNSIVKYQVQNLERRISMRPSILFLQTRESQY